MEETRFKDLKCIHRKRWPEHQSCFLKGKIKYAEDVQVTSETWYEKSQLKIGFLDIESDGLKVDFSTMLTWCIKEKGKEEILNDFITRDELFSGNFDKRIVYTLVQRLREFDIVVGFYSKRFDMTFVRAKAMHYGFTFPLPTDLYHWDLYDTVKSKLGSLSRRSLDATCDYLGIEGKTPIDKEVWRKAKYGDPESIAQVLEHNKADVKITEMLWEKLEPYQVWNKSKL